jgi:UDP-N-acetylmuramate dehydrogenase
MTTNLSFSRDVSLQPYNTFGIAAQANYFLSVTDIDQLQALRDDPVLAAMPRLILGGGSNLVLSDQVDALVLKMDLLGKSIVGEDAEFVYVQAQAGENWHAFVQWTLALGLGGLENLSLIPGTVGAAPIQNIGAYGMEVQDALFQLEAFDFATGEMLVLDKAACQFAYRDSIFKHALKDRVAITSVQFALPKQWQPKIGMPMSPDICNCKRSAHLRHAQSAMRLSRYVRRNCPTRR